MNMMDEQSKFSRLLQSWEVTASLPPGFQDRVWKRIERQEVPDTSLVAAWRAWMAAAFARPAFAFAYVTILMVAGLLLGYRQAHQQVLKWDRQLEVRYVQSVDPYQKAGGP